MNQENKNKTITFDLCKKPLYSIKVSFRILERRLKTAGFKIVYNEKDINDSILNQTLIYIIISPQAYFDDKEFECLKNFIENDGILWILMNEGGEKFLKTNINSFLENYGLKTNNDSVIRTSYYKYFHPKEVFISNGILNRSLVHSSIKLKKENKKTLDESLVENDDLDSENNLNFLFSQGSTINVEKPSISLLSTGTASFPINRPVCGFLNNEKGKILLIGSSTMFSDNYIEKEDNALLIQIFLKYSLEKNLQLNSIDAENPDISEYYSIPNISFLSNLPLPYFQETEKIPNDFLKLIFENNRDISDLQKTLEYKELFQFDNITYPLVLGCYNEFNMDHEPLTLIKPVFQTPLPPLEPAVFSPRFRGLTRPNLELYDLDEEFCSVKTRLQQLANKCSDSDLDYFIQECAKILGIIDANTRTSKEILERTFKKIIQFKKIN